MSFFPIVSRFAADLFSGSSTSLHRHDGPGGVLLPVNRVWVMIFARPNFLTAFLFVPPLYRRRQPNWSGLRHGSRSSVLQVCMY